MQRCIACHVGYANASRNCAGEKQKSSKTWGKGFCLSLWRKEFRFLKDSKDNESWWYSYWKAIDTKSKIKYTVKTKRNVKIGSTESYVKKQYGNTSKIKVNGKDGFYILIKYNYFQIDVSAWKNYLEYNYKKGSDNYKIRFYLDKKSHRICLYKESI